MILTIWHRLGDSCEHALANMLMEEPVFSQGEAWYEGEDMLPDNVRDFAAVVLPLANVYTAERPVEAQHAKTNRRASSARFHSVVYMSLELRLLEIRTLMQSKSAYVKRLARFALYTHSPHE